MGIIQKLKNEGVLSLYHDYRSGTALDWSGKGVHGSLGTGGVFNLNGLQHNGAASHIVSVSSATLPTNNYAMVFGFNSPIRTHTDLQYPVYVGASGYIRYSAGTLLWQLYGGGTARSFTTPLGTSTVSFNVVAGTAQPAYANGIFISNFSGAMDALDFSSGAAYIAVSSGGLYPLLSGCKYFLLVSRVLTATEHSQLYGELQSIVWPSLPSSTKYIDLKHNSSVAGLSGCYDMVPLNGYIMDQSSVGKNMAITKAVAEMTPLGTALKFNGVDSYCTTLAAGNVANVGFSAWFSTTNTATDNVLYANVDNAAGILGSCGFDVGKLAYSKTNSTAKFETVASYNDGLWHWVYFDGTNDLIYVDGVPVATQAGTFYTATTYETIGARYSGGAWSSLFNGLIACARIHTAPLSAAQVWAQYESFGHKAVGMASGWGTSVSTASRGGITGSYLENTRWQFGSTTPRYTVAVSSIGGEPCKVIKCGTTGLLYKPTDSHFTPQQAAYGTWEWTCYKSSDVNVSVIPFIANIIGTYNTALFNGYSLGLISDESIGILKTTSGSPGYSIRTGPGYIANSTWYTIRITRSFAGVFTMWIKGGAYTNWTFVGSATDTAHTLSNYQVLSLGVGDMVSMGSIGGKYSMRWSPFV